MEGAHERATNGRKAGRHGPARLLLLYAKKGGGAWLPSYLWLGLQPPPPRRTTVLLWLVATTPPSWSRDQATPPSNKKILLALVCLSSLRDLAS